MNATKQEAPERQEIEELLPWHAAGTLSRRDAQRVEEALARDPELARRYALVRDELGETIHFNETLGAPSARALEQLFAKIDAEPARRQGSSNVSLNLGSRISEFFASLTPRTLALASGAAVLAILVQAGFIAGVMLNETKTGGYQTTSAPQRRRTPSASRSFALRHRLRQTTSRSFWKPTSCRSQAARQPAACTRSALR